MSLQSYRFDNVVVGNDLEAVSHAYANQLPLILNGLSPPFFFETERSMEWNQKLFLLSLAGLIPLADKVLQIRIIDEHQLKVTTAASKVINVHFNCLTVFNDKNMGGLPLPKKEQKRKLVLDWMKPTSCAKHELSVLSTDDDFVKEVIFYPAKCVSGKAIVAKSYLTQAQIESYDHSDTYSRFKVENMMKAKGVRGRYNGQWIKNPNQKLYYALHLRVEKREIKELQMNLYEDTDTIKFKYSSETDIIKNDNYSYLNLLGERLVR